MGPEFIGSHSAGSFETSITLGRSPGFEFRHQDDFVSSLAILPFCGRTHENPLRPTHLDLSGACVFPLTIDVHSAKSASYHLSQLLAPLNYCLESLKLPKGPHLSFFLTALRNRVYHFHEFLPNLKTLSGSFVLESVKLFETLPSLTSLELDSIVLQQRNCVSSHVYGQDPSLLHPLANCHRLTNLSLPCVDERVVSLMGKYSYGSE